jgi:uncharacterized repeat protein (TIGR03843 family)
MSTDKRQSAARSLSRLAEGELDIVGRLPWSSNFTFLVDVHHEGTTSKAVYKPEQGEQDLWDFPTKIYKREIAAFELSCSLGWPDIPPTIERVEAPYGVGSLQEFVPADFEQHYFTVMEADEENGSQEHHDAFMRIAVFDLVANNTDRKAGHCLIGEDGTIYAIDNGLCFHAEPKLRTVIWDFQGMPIPPPLLEDLQRVAEGLPPSVLQWINEEETAALLRRIGETLENPVFPALTSQRQYPWPII